MRLRSRTGSLWASVLLSGAAGAFGVASALGPSATFGATNPCTGFRWNVEHERALFGSVARSEVAGRDAASAPIIVADRLYDLALTPQQDVHFLQRPEKRALTDGAYAGLTRLRVATAGLYRISIDGPFWIDVIAKDQIVESRDFAGRGGCGAPRKIVVYELPAGSLVLQLSGAISPRVRVTLTRVPDQARPPAPGPSP